MGGFIEPTQTLPRSAQRPPQSLATFIRTTRSRTRCPPAPAVARAGRIVRRHQLRRARRHRKGREGNEGGEKNGARQRGTGEGIAFLGRVTLRMKGKYASRRWHSCIRLPFRQHIATVSCQVLGQNLGRNVSDQKGRRHSLS